MSDAVAAGRSVVRNVLTFDRKTFEADFQRASDGETGSVRSDLLNRKVSLLASMQKQHIDLQGRVGALGVETVDRDSIRLLISATGNQVSDSGAATPTTRTSFIVTMDKVGSHWLASDMQAIGLK